ncbi:MAG: formyltetrahydrofolate deformylase [Omnitrophica WOR_2 bacterium RIFCSPHIGHO2_02_FULL_52_10]|nr:MAG: formyltetrahydrofolate deformylase [Omnitrophica WOR_2 bacterium RIFCSPHIGHO2_02_FULL_52_10]
MNHAVLLLSSPDRRGITATVTNFIYEHNGNIVHADQHIDEQSNTFFMRVEWSLDGFKLGKQDIGKKFRPIAAKFKMRWDLSFSDQRPRVAIFVSRHLHCLHDLLYRHADGQLNCEIPLIISNHPGARPVAEHYGIAFHEILITKGNKRGQEKKEMELLKKNGIDLLVLARYHQIFTEPFVTAFEHRIVNIHHSFLPAFAGKNPYLQAFKKGVKIIGATSHFVTPALDEGPIIEQDTVRVSHRDSLDDLVRKGEDLEKVVLSRAVRLALEKKILSYGNKTVIFD